MENEKGKKRREKQREELKRTKEKVKSMGRSMEIFASLPSTLTKIGYAQITKYLDIGSSIR